jgi:predicted nucleic acid-binding protein
MKTALIDANIIIRFLIGDDKKLYEKAAKIFDSIERGKQKAIICEAILMEIYFVMTKFYELPKTEVINDLKKILSLDAIISNDKTILLETLSILEYTNVDFADALLCAKAKFFGYEVLSFDKDIAKCLKYN